MAVTLKRRRDAVSYKEPSSDDDLLGASDSDHTPEKRRAAPQRRSARHQDPESRQLRTVFQQTQTSSTSSNHQRLSAKDESRLRRHTKVSYRESSSDEDSGTEFEPDQPTLPPQRTTQRTGATPITKSSKRSRGRPRKAFGASKRPNVPNVPDVKVKRPAPAIITDGKIPAWERLPYHVLLQIFVYASHPLHDDNFNPTPSILWLARTARLCPAFTKPALTALYRNPPIFAMGQNRKALVHHLISPPEDAHEDYSVMVKRLELDATKMSKLTDAQNSQDDLKALVMSFKTLKEIDFFDPFDKAPYRARSRRIRKWYYPDDLLTTLGNSDIRLKSWHWNSTFCGQGILRLKEVHTSNAFQSLRELTLTKFDPRISRKTSETESEPTEEELLGSALSVLPNLRSLTFETCEVVNYRLLPLLPSNLVTLNITNCQELLSDPLHAFLADNGQRIEELTLNHNQSLDLAFLVDLKQTCPRLEALKMDMHYYNTLSFASDNEPLYDELLPGAIPPTWPSSLRVIDLEFLRMQSDDAAVAFFTSLIDAADALPWLRVIVLSTIIDIEWRQRAAFRQKWTAQFEQVFTMRSSAPSPHLVSLRAFREWKASKDQQLDQQDIDVTADTIPIGANRSNSRQLTEESESEDNTSDQSELTARERKQSEKWDTKRLRTRGKSSAHYDETTDSEDESDRGDDSETEKIKFIQGRCHTLEFRIDNSRPQEQLYEEADFLDDELSGDSDWNGEDPPEQEE
ncbi:hypothetical protein K491DRAFT_589680 [Lophiostoma macrostomum CBS 122681]|uniref:Uncharacterized protein n=1 Tax=Lophiostoma macrostomum CBS 122681 TaxID=1314788 RepID=A0A6A6TJR2_9PLEO|nr:hypothetical protein K491DRAFT_589680 [Lophiostoma macrostomum CBS 122681]